MEKEIWKQVTGFENYYDKTQRKPTYFSRWSCQATINVDNVEFEDKSVLTLYVSWYKNRGTTDAMWLLNECDIPIKPTYNDLEAIVKYYKNKK